ncbi:interferon regulatory factor 7 isoform X1 [Gadus macrocephalus]|uniref:interferon regulatory factor 7 isoform X1 n=1 Tax=Gadus macrocephalus TaxID=80720 RepID=UPI0028CB51F1|nr:interferon regulatory factor 7 isoform X1 [Gadus macrocephalus]
MQSSHKPLFANWLIEQVETGNYPGLSYISTNLFRVPWKHNSRKDCNDEDCKIFRAWAVASGKIHEFPNDKAKWKTNFRCALKNLNKRFRMTKDNSKNSDDPHKIYEIINREAAYQPSPPEEDMVPVIYSSPTESYPPGHEQNILEQLMTLDLLDEPRQQTVGEQWAESYGQQSAIGLGVYATNQQATGETMHAMQTQPQLQPQRQAYYPVNPPPVLDSGLQPSLFDLEISVHYRKVEMLKTQVSWPRVQLHYGNEATELQAQPICFPPTDTLRDHKQVEFTNRILSSIQRGLLLEVRESGLYACRQDRCHVFASTADPSQASPDPQKLPQNTLVELLSFEKFVKELKEFKENRRGSPEYVVNMCFGEKFPDGKPLEKKLIVVKVVPLICRYFYEMAQTEGASSLDSTNVSLQISHDSLYDLISSAFGLPVSQVAPQLVGHY